MEPQGPCPTWVARTNHELVRTMCQHPVPEDARATARARASSLQYSGPRRRRVFCAAARDEHGCARPGIGVPGGASAAAGLSAERAREAEGVTHALHCVRGLYGVQPRRNARDLQGAVACGATCAELRAKDEARQPRRRAHNVCWVESGDGERRCASGDVCPHGA